MAAKVHGSDPVTFGERVDLVPPQIVRIAQTVQQNERGTRSLLSVPESRCVCRRVQ